MKIPIVNPASYQAGFGNRRVERVPRHPSLTVPGMTLSLRELLDRYTRGMDVEQFNPVYTGDDDVFPADYEKLDVFEKIEAAAQIREQISLVQRRPTKAPSDTSSPAQAEGLAQASAGA